MSSKMKRLLALVLSVVMMVSLVACGNTPTEETKSNEVKSTEAVKTDVSATESGEFDPRSITEGVTLKVAVPMAITVEDWETNEVTLAIEEALGVDLTFEVYGSADYTEKLNVMVNGGDELPDIIMGFIGSGQNISSSVTEWKNAGALTDLTEYFENPEYAKYLYADMEEEGDMFLDRCRDADGKIWGFPSYLSGAIDMVPYNLIINEEFCKQLGYDVPTTTDEFLEVARAFKAAGDVNGNGKDDEVVLTGRGDNLRWFNCLMTSFEYAWGDNYLVAEDGKLHFAYTTDEWKEGLKYVRTFFEEGLIDTGALTNDKTAYNSIIACEDPRVLSDVYFWVDVEGHDEMDKYQNKLMYNKDVFLTSPVNSDVKSHYDPVDPVTTAVISADCENPLAAFLVLDYMCSDTMSITNRYGKQGVNWDYWENANESLLPEGKTLDMYASRNTEKYPTPHFIVYDRMWGGTEAQNVMYMGIGPAFSGDKLRGGEAILSVGETELDKLMIEWEAKWEKSAVDALNKIPDVVVSEAILPMTADENDELVDIKSTLSSYVKESIACFLTGQWDIDTYWDTYLNELDKIGVDAALELYQTAFNRSQK